MLQLMLVEGENLLIVFFFAFVHLEVGACLLGYLT